MAIQHHDDDGRDLTPRELEILSAVEKGYSNKRIAEYLRISEDSVAYHVSNLYQKAGLAFWRPAWRRLIFFKAHRFYVVCALVMLLAAIFRLLSGSR